MIVPKGVWCLAALASIFAVKPIRQLALQPDIPSHMVSQSTTLIPELLTIEQQGELVELMKDFGSLPSNLADSKVTMPQHEHIGEAVPIQSEPLPLCPHPYMIPNINRTLCILANRIDIGRHYITTGGYNGAKEPYAVAVGRLQSFGRYIFDPSTYPVVEKLFTCKGFQDAAKNTCPFNSQVLDPFQFNLIVQVPGQTVATHIDGVYFWGATRFEFPQWLLAAMKFSGLFEDRFIPQIQIVAYFHEWKDEEGLKKGSFIFWNQNDVPVEVPPTSRSASGIDGSTVVHAANTYLPEKQPPLTDKDKDVELRYSENGDLWTVFEDGKPTQYTYQTSDLRSTIVFRARCFETEEKKELFNRPGAVPKLSLSAILRTFQADMERRANRSMANLPPLDLAIMIMDTYIRYPYPHDSFVPFNYCVVEKLLGGGEALRFLFNSIGCRLE